MRKKMKEEEIYLEGRRYGGGGKACVIIDRSGRRWGESAAREVERVSE